MHSPLSAALSRRRRKYLTYMSILLLVVCNLAAVSFFFQHSCRADFDIPLQRRNFVDEFAIWPDTNGDLLNRTANQLNFLSSYARRTNGTVRSTKSILIVGEFYFDFEEAQRSFVTDKCPISECSLTVNAARYRRTVDAVIILNMDASTLCNFLPKPAHQIWIANHWESPLHNRIETTAFRQYINWSSSYRHDSHIVTPYGGFERRQGNDLSMTPFATTSTFNYAAGKTKKVAWIVSNCNDKNGRWYYANELGRFISVDMYGECGRISCSLNKAKECLEMLKTDYKFYLAFENSNCIEYISEKVFRNSMSYNVIPIVMGARPQDYAAVLPPHSFIHVDDFRSPRELADYLHGLDKNDTLYNEYFRWKLDWRPVTHSYWCRLCGLLHVASETGYVHWYSDYSRWWDGDDGTACKSTWTKRSGIWWRRWRNL